MNTIITPLKEGEKVTQKRKREAMLALARLDELRIRRPKPEDDAWTHLKDDDWYIAVFKKFGYVRMIKDKRSLHWVTTTYGRINGKSDYYGLDVNTGEMIPQKDAYRLYHMSRI